MTFSARIGNGNVFIWSYVGRFWIYKKQSGNIKFVFEWVFSGLQSCTYKPTRIFNWLTFMNPEKYPPLLSHVVGSYVYPPPPPQRGFLYKSDRDARHLSLRCYLENMASLRVFGMERYYNCTFRYRLIVCIKKFTKNVLTLAIQKEPHPHWFPLGVLF